jgi:hypothetical protein
MDPEKVKRIARRGGVADHHGPRGFAALSPEENRELAHRGGVAEHRGPRGFAALDPRERRELARRGGEAPHRGPRGFAALNAEEQRRLASRGGEAAHGSRVEWDVAPIGEGEDQWGAPSLGGHGGDFGGGRRGRLSSRSPSDQRLTEPERGGGWDDDVAYDDGDAETEIETDFDDDPRASAERPAFDASPRTSPPRGNSRARIKTSSAPSRARDSSRRGPPKRRR